MEGAAVMRRESARRTTLGVEQTTLTIAKRILAGPLHCSVERLSLGHWGILTVSPASPSTGGKQRYGLTPPHVPGDDIVLTVPPSRFGVALTRLHLESSSRVSRDGEGDGGRRGDRASSDERARVKRFEREIWQ